VRNPRDAEGSGKGGPNGNVAQCIAPVCPVADSLRLEPCRAPPDSASARHAPRSSGSGTLAGAFLALVCRVQTDGVLRRFLHAAHRGGGRLLHLIDLVAHRILH
jgi:hypothetical protein